MAVVEDAGRQVKGDVLAEDAGNLSGKASQQRILGGSSRKSITAGDSGWQPKEGNP